jgi:hypothetical protein
MSCTVWPGPNSIPVVRFTGVVVRGAIQSGPVMLESVCVIVLASVGVVVPGVVVVDDPFTIVVVPVVVVVVVEVVGVVREVGDVVAAEPPARLIAAPQVAVVPVFVTSTSVTINVCPAGTVNAVTAVVPAGTMRVISTTLRTVGVVVPTTACGNALAELMVVGGSGDVVVVAVVSGPKIVVVPVPIVDV